MNATPARSGVRIHRVLMAMDFSECSSRALQHALAIVHRYGADIDFVHVIQPASYSLSGPEVLVQAHALAEREMKEFVSSLRRKHALEGGDSRSWVLDGDVAEVVCRIVGCQGTDLVVLGTHGRSGLRKLVLGSVAETVFRQSPCPVLTVGPYSPGTAGAPRLKHVVFATDFSTASVEALPWAITAAQDFGARLTMLHVCPNLKGEAVHDRRRVDAALQGRLRDLLATYPACASEPRFEIAYGTAENEIVHFATVHKADAIVLGLKSPQVFADRIPWLSAYRIVCEAPCPVLTVRAKSRL